MVFVELAPRPGHLARRTDVAQWLRDLNLIRRAVAQVVVDGLRETQQLVLKVHALILAAEGQVEDAAAKITRFKRLLDNRAAV